jgi:hypothetical protein
MADDALVLDTTTDRCSSMSAMFLNSSYCTSVFTNGTWYISGADWSASLASFFVSTGPPIAKVYNSVKAAMKLFMKTVTIFGNTRRFLSF